MKLSLLNTKSKGTYEFFIYPEKGKYIGVCLTLNIVEEGKDAKKLLSNLLNAAQGHIRVVIKENLSDYLLNRPAPKHYWAKMEKYLSLKNKIESRKNTIGKLPSSFYDTAHFDIPLEILYSFQNIAPGFK